MKIIMNLFKNLDYVAFYIYYISEPDRSYLRNKNEKKDNLCCLNTELPYMYF